jgi:glycosyltransferase involved in cell wall biosynthesis
MPLPAKIMHVITTTMVGGAEVQLIRLIAASDPGRFEHTVVGLGLEGPLALPLRQAGAEVISLGLKPAAAALPKGVGQLVRLMGKIRPDLVQGWMYHANLLGLIAARLTGSRPVIWGVFCSDMDMSQYSAGARLLFKACVLTSKQPRAIVSNTHQGVDFHVGLGYPRATQLVIPNGFDTLAFQPDPQARAEVRAELGLGQEHLLVGKVARFDAMKDHQGLLKAFTEVVADYPQARLVTLGLDMVPDNPALKAALEPPLAGKVFLPGRRHDVPRWLQAMDLHVSASAFGEGLSNAVGEAMASGVPNLVTDVGDSARLVGDTGLVVPPGQPQALAGAIEHILAMSPQQRTELGLAARARIEEHYSLAAMAKAYHELYDRVLGIS